MKDSELRLDRTCHVLYSKPCKAQIQEKIALHYPPGRPSHGRSPTSPSRRRTCSSW